MSTSEPNIRIKLKSYDHHLVESAMKEIVETTLKTGARIKGPIPLPSKNERWTVLISPFVNKDARDRYQIRTHIRLLDIVQPEPVTIDALMQLNLASGVNVSLMVINNESEDGK